jgi:pimeloyl-ACP methyl ester carboxylesterase
LKVRSNGLEFEVESKGDINAPVVLLTMGLGMQLVSWPSAFVDSLVNAGYRVVRYDNRDIGLSSHLDHFGVPNMALQLLKARIGLSVRAPYSLQDMAKDALGILDALSIGQAHIVGVSMGGMISQRIAFTAPKRALSLTSIMSTSGAPGLPSAKPPVVRAMLKKPKSQRIEDIVSHSADLFQLIGSPAYPQDALYPDRLKMAVERAYHPVGMLRQLLAIAADTKRYQFLSQIKCPTLVIHGEVDPLVPIACGRDTASRIEGSRFMAIDGMGHDFPPGVAQLLSDLIVPHLDSKL